MVLFTPARRRAGGGLSRVGGVPSAPVPDRSRWPVPPTPTNGDVDVVVWCYPGMRILVTIQLRLVGKGMGRPRRSSIPKEGHRRFDCSQAPCPSIGK